MKKETGKKVKNFFLDVLFFVIGSLSYAISVSVFTAPNNIAPGGVTGIATVINYLFGTQIGLMIVILNIPLMIAGLIILGWRFIAKTLVVLAVSSVMIDAIDLLLPTIEYTSNPLLAAMFGGVLSGVGLAFIYMRGATTGGTDVAAKLVNKFKPHLKMGQVMMIFDMLVVVGATFVYKDVELALYAVVTIFLTGQVIDKVMDGLDMGKLTFIITSEPEKTADDILKKMDRGATILNGMGAYSREDKNVLMCAVRRNEMFRLKQVVYENDPSAFIIVGDATQIYGEGFKSMKEEQK